MWGANNPNPNPGYNYNQYLYDLMTLVKPDVLMYDYYPFRPGDPYSEAKLIALGHALEQALSIRRPPALRPTAEPA